VKDLREVIRSSAASREVSQQADLVLPPSVELAPPVVPPGGAVAMAGETSGWTEGTTSQSRGDVV